ncbi:hypothetical protein D3C81_1121280 [compost metagenome]
MQAAVGEGLRQFHHRLLGAGGDHGARHQVAHGAGQPARAGIALRGEEVTLRDDALEPVVRIDHRQRLDAVPRQQVAGLVRGLLGPHQDDVPRHDLAAQHVAEVAPVRVQLRRHQDGFQVVFFDVEEFAACLQGRVQVGTGKAHALRRRQVPGAMLHRGLGRAVRVAPLRQVVEGQRHQQQQHRVEQHRHHHEAETERADRGPAEYGRDGHGAAGRVHAAELEHHGNRHGHRCCRGKARVRNPARAGYAHQRGKKIAADDRPRLRQWRRRHREQQYRRGAHRRDEPGIESAQRLVADPFGAEQA